MPRLLLGRRGRNLYPPPPQQEQAGAQGQVQGAGGYYYNPYDPSGTNNGMGDAGGAYPPYPGGNPLFHRSRVGVAGGGGFLAGPPGGSVNMNGQNPPASGGGSICSRQSFMILTIGILMGYVLLPMVLVEMNNDVFMHLAEPKLEKKQAFEPPVRAKTTLENKSQLSQLSERIRPVRNLFPNKVVAESDDDDENTPPKMPPREGEEEDEPRSKNAFARLVEDQNLLSQQSLPTPTTPKVMQTLRLPDHHRMKILVTGGAGFVGSHLVDKLMMQGHEVIVVDNFFTGQKKNIAHWLHHPNFSIIVHDVTEPIQLEVDQIYHLACPASPPHYQYNPVKTIKTSTMGTLNMLGLAKRVRARILLTSTSEIYGDPKEHPQHESYWGNVNTIGPRSCYDEGKRVAETMMYSYKSQNGVDVRVARIFNTFGPRMHPNDGRVVSNFIIQALQQKDLTIYGEGQQTRSFQYVHDLVEGLHALMNGDYDLPVNLGNPDEFSVKNFAQYIKEMTESSSNIVHLPKSQDDPSQRRPDISTAMDKLNWKPTVSVREGLGHTIEYFSRVLKEAGEIIPTGPGAAKPEA